jgi:uncharacterized protein (DUF1786 family)
MDTAPAAVLGATLDKQVQTQERVIITNIGNFHTLAFRLGPTGVEGVFEHHTGFMNLAKMEFLLEAFADGTLTNEFVFNDMGHGAIVTHSEPYPIHANRPGVIVTGPRRNILFGSLFSPYFAVPHGDMMLAGCFGMVAAAADVFPDWGDEIRQGLNKDGNQRKPPWEVGS